MALSKFQQEVRTKVLQQLEMGPHSIGELASNLKYNYHSVRQQVRQLEQEGILKSLGNSHRNVKYTYGADNGPNNIIPMLRTSSGIFKLQTILELRHTENPHASMAILNLPRHVVRILAASIRINKGHTDAPLTLTALRAEMEQDLSALRNSVNVYEQILQDDRNWNPDVLKRYPNDVTFDETEVMNTYHEYFTKN